MSNSPWQLDDTFKLAQLTSNQLSGRIELGFQHRGWQSLAISGESLAIQPGMVILPDVSDAPLAPMSIHIRGNDLVANYAANEQRTFMVQIYRTASETKIGNDTIWKLSTLVSLNTHRLDGSPSLELAVSYPPESELLAANPDEPLLSMDSFAEAKPAAMLIRPDGINHSYVEVVDPIDFQSWEGHADSWKHRFEEPLEKGVIRRIRSWSAIIPRENDLGHAESLRMDFAAEAPPLTA